MHKFPLILVSVFLSINICIAQWEFIGSPETGRAFHYAKDGGRLFVCAKAGLYYSDDDGLSWSQVNTFPEICTANKVLADNGVIYLLTNEDPILQYLYKYDLFRSKNFGETWENIYPFQYINFTFLPPVVKGDTLLLV